MRISDWSSDVLFRSDRRPPTRRSDDDAARGEFGTAVDERKGRCNDGREHAEQSPQSVAAMAGDDGPDLWRYAARAAGTERRIARGCRGPAVEARAGRAVDRKSRRLNARH